MTGRRNGGLLGSRAPEGYLLLEDGARFPGRVAAGEATAGEAVFTTNMSGYQEVLTDPSYAGQIVVMTAPMIGVYGVRAEDDQSRRPWVAGFVVRRLSGEPGDEATDGSLLGYLREHGIPTLTEVDTRALTRHIREEGAMRAVLVPATVGEDRARELLEAERPMKGRDLASEVSVEEAHDAPAHGPERGLIVCLDYGVKRRSLELFQQDGFRVRVLPASVDAEEILSMDPDGVFVSNGPGDPDAVEGAVDRIRTLTGAGLPLFGICLGHQLVARAFGGHSFKLAYGHRGGNHPVKDLETGAIEITSQNHGFAVREEDGGIAGAPDLEITHRNLNDGTIEGLTHRELPVFAVQYHPESAPGPHDSRHLFARFRRAVGVGARS